MDGIVGKGGGGALAIGGSATQRTSETIPCASAEQCASASKFRCTAFAEMSVPAGSSDSVSATLATASNGERRSCITCAKEKRGKSAAGFVRVPRGSAERGLA